MSLVGRIFWVWRAYFEITRRAEAGQELFP